MPIASWNSGTKATAAPKASVGRISPWGAGNQPNNPSASQLAVMRGKVPGAGDKEGLAAALNRISAYHPDDRVRILNRAAQVGLVDRGRAASMITGTLKNNAPAPIPLSGPQRTLQGAVNFASRIPAAIKTEGNAVASIVKPLAPIVKNFAPLAGPTSTQTQRDAVVKNQSIVLPKNNASVKANIQARAMLASGAKPNDVKVFLAKAEEEKRKQNTSLAGALAYGASLAVGGEGLAGARTVAGAVKATLPTTIAGGVGGAGATLAENPSATGKDISKSAAMGTAAGFALPFVGAGIGKLNEVFRAGPKELLKNVKTTQLVDAGREANKPIKVPVSDVTGGRVESVDVRTPARPTIEGVSTADKINVRTPQRMSEQQFNKQFTKISSDFDKETKQLEATAKTAPATHVQIIQQALETKYQNKLQDLVDTYHNPPLSAPVAPKPIRMPRQPSTPTTPRSTTRTATLTKPAPTRVATERVNVMGQAKAVTPIPEAATTKVSGSALKSEARAVEQHLAKEFEDKAQYATGSYKQEAENAAKLVNEDHPKALAIATGTKPGNNTIHEVAVAKAVENKALKEGDVETLQKLASSSRHSATSEAAQRLGAEGYGADPHSPVQAMAALNRDRAKAFERRSGTSVEKAVQKDVKAYNKVAPTKNDWESFVRGLACK